MKSQSGWFKNQSWEDGLELCEFWFRAVSDRLENSQEVDETQFHRTTIRLIDFCYDVAKIDPLPLWEVYIALTDQVGAGTEDSLAHLRYLSRRAEMIVHRLQRKGLVFPKSALRETNGPSQYGQYFVWENWRFPLTPGSHLLASQLWDSSDNSVEEIAKSNEGSETLNTAEKVEAQVARLNLELEGNGIPVRGVLDNGQILLE